MTGVFSGVKQSLQNLRDSVGGPPTPTPDSRDTSQLSQHPGEARDMFEEFHAALMTCIDHRMKFRAFINIYFACAEALQNCCKSLRKIGAPRNYDGVPPQSAAGLSTLPENTLILMNPIMGSVTIEAAEDLREMKRKIRDRLVEISTDVKKRHRDMHSCHGALRKAEAVFKRHQQELSRLRDRLQQLYETSGQRVQMDRQRVFERLQKVQQDSNRSARDVSEEVEMLKRRHAIHFDAISHFVAELASLQRKMDRRMADELSRLPLDFRGSVEEAVMTCQSGPTAPRPAWFSADYQPIISHRDQCLMCYPALQSAYLVLEAHASGKDQFTEYRATSSFVGQRDGELSFERGDVIFVTRKSSGVDIGSIYAVGVAIPETEDPNITSVHPGGHPLGAITQGGEALRGLPDARPPVAASMPHVPMSSREIHVEAGEQLEILSEPIPGSDLVKIMGPKSGTSPNLARMSHPGAGTHSRYATPMRVPTIVEEDDEAAAKEAENMSGNIQRTQEDLRHELPVTSGHQPMSTVISLAEDDEESKGWGIVQQMIVERTVLVNCAKGRKM
ncbi:hypothetical protein Pmar_PMAR004715 [Perkinsus marinus ATCC 50983]|uniref:SH3 domain-containing protein n=1 Tax=Perkinsus marinus (strain ATCC 50983 / TXsc) TaxID=423536 RepID=C5KF61_PERM5|nr:hypothetical protein Pmar_PMAR004715 [Perkinsus marinus ATCC 50983]EER16863.1 hypothetical protein Pmar_PMAR004715 [Perkinsus marinus ATCC 50983]|eukprot:XP_002785067.1 hypothetical protein Pmar_PMAR004715 [Perkinsus marinus ATCC 50983]